MKFHHGLASAGPFFLLFLIYCQLTFDIFSYSILHMEILVTSLVSPVSLFIVKCEETNSNLELVDDACGHLWNENKLFFTEVSPNKHIYDFHFCFKSGSVQFFQ